MRRLVPIGALLVAACQPQATRLLLLDESLTQSAELESTARPWARKISSRAGVRGSPMMTDLPPPRFSPAAAAL